MLRSGHLLKETYFHKPQSMLLVIGLIDKFLMHSFEVRVASPCSVVLVFLAILPKSPEFCGEVTEKVSSIFALLSSVCDSNVHMHAFAAQKYKRASMIF